MDRIRAFSLEPAIREVRDLVFSGGRLWVLDGTEDRLVVYDARGRRLRDVAGGESGHPLREGWRLAQAGGTVAVVEGDARIRFFSERGEEGRLKVPPAWYAPQGLFLTPSRLFFTYLAWLGPGEEGRGKGPYATLLSTDWKGKDERAYEQMEAGTPELETAGLWNAYSSWVEWPDHGWVLARSLPLSLCLFSGEGTLLKRFAPEKAKPELPPPASESKENTLKSLARDRVIGLIPAGAYLGVVWQKRRPGLTALRVEWLDGNFQEAGAQEVPFPRALDLQEGVEVADTLKARGAFLILRRLTSHYTQVTELYEWPFLQGQPESLGRDASPSKKKTGA
ncbi:MAG: hypothetical protein ACOYXN_12905 [Acidobacteriota bacterium]